MKSALQIGAQFTTYVLCLSFILLSCVKIIGFEHQMLQFLSFGFNREKLLLFGLIEFMAALGLLYRSYDWRGPLSAGLLIVDCLMMLYFLFRYKSGNDAWLYLTLLVLLIMWLAMHKDILLKLYREFAKWD